GELLLVAGDGRRLRVDLSAAPGPIALPEPATVVGVVRSLGEDPSTPLPGALVWPSHDPGAAVLTDGEGRFRLRAGVGDRFRIQAHAPGHVAAARRVMAKAEGHPVDLQLHPARRVAGRVVDGAGVPLAGVSLRADAAGEPAAMVFDSAAARATTDAEGRFELVGLDPARPHGLLARRPGFAPWNGSLGPTPLADSPGDLDIVLVRGRLAYGRVVDLDDRPIPGATVRVRPHGDGEPDGDPEPAARADADGRFELRGLPSLHLDVVAAADGFAPLEVKGVQVADGDGPVDLGTLLLAPGVELRGLALGPEGAPVAEAEAWVLADGADDDRPSSPAAAQADAEGRLAVAGLEAGRTVDLLVDAPGYLPQRLRGLVPPAAFEARLRPAASLGGRVVDRAGAPIEGAEVSVAVADAIVGAEDVAESKSDGAAISAERRRTVRSDAEGRFLLADVPPGPAEVEAWATGFQPTAPRRLDLSPEETPQLRLVLDAGAAVVGRVVDVEGEPVEGARVNAGRPWGDTDADGRYRLAGIPPSAEALEVTAVHPGYQTQRAEVEIVSEVTTVDFVLDGGRRVAGRVVDGAGAPLPGVALHLVPADPDSPLADHRATSDGDGGFELAPVPDGHYRLMGSRGGLVQGDPPDVQVAGASVDGIELELAAGARLEGQILGLDFEAMARLELRAEADGRAPLAGEVDFEGRYRIADLAQDDWTVIARLDAGRRQVRARFTVEAGEPLIERDLEFGAGAQLTGTVLHGSEPLAGAQLELRHSVAGRRAVTTDPQGQFQVEDLDLGRYRLSVAHRERGLVHNEDLSLQGDRDVVVELSTSGAVGQVVDGVTGAGVGGASVVFQQELPGGASGSIFTAGTDGGGTFRQERLPPGSYRVEVRRNDYQVVEERVQVPAGAAVEGLRFEIQPAAGLDVVVQLSSGAPPGYITLRGQGAGGRTFAETRASVDGGAPFSTLPPGRWRLWVGATGGAAVERSVEVPSEPLAVVLPDAGRLRVRVPSLVDAEAVASLVVRDAAGRPFQHLAWGGALETAWTVSGGRAVVEGIPAGQWTVEATAADGRVFSAVAVTTGGPDVEVTLR
ncbi:MAG: carboxypeptidase-like regulatory domain-containing protein, partial [Acidobacteriota bacterium]